MVSQRQMTLFLWPTNHSCRRLSEMSTWRKRKVEGQRVIQNWDRRWVEGMCSECVKSLTRVTRKQRQWSDLGAYFVKVKGSQRVWKSRTVFITSNWYTWIISKCRVLIFGATCSVVSYDDIENTGRSTPLRLSESFWCFNVRTTPYARLLTFKLSKQGVKAGIICVEHCWSQQRPAADSNKILFFRNHLFRVCSTTASYLRGLGFKFQCRFRITCLKSVTSIYPDIWRDSFWN